MVNSGNLSTDIICGTSVYYIQQSSTTTAWMLKNHSHRQNPVYLLLGKRMYFAKETLDSELDAW